MSSYSQCNCKDIKHLGKIPVQVCKENSRQLVELFNAANTDLEQENMRKP